VNGGYRCVAHPQADEVLLRSAPAVRRFLLGRFDNLAADSFLSNEAHFTDEAGREVQLQAAGRHVITYWADHAEKEVRIFAIEIV
jgi:hypothetical protein